MSLFGRGEVEVELLPGRNWRIATAYTSVTFDKGIKDVRLSSACFVYHIKLPTEQFLLVVLPKSTKPERCFDAQIQTQLKHSSLDMHASTLLLALAAAIPSTLALPEIFIGTVDTCSPGRYPTNYAAWLVNSDACANGNSSALTLIGAYPITNAGCDLGAFTVGGYDNITFTGCLGPPGPYPTAVLRNGEKKLECAPVRQAKEDKLCESALCPQQNRKGVLKTVLRCRKTDDCED
jgi:hypothetical protein